MKTIRSGDLRHRIRFQRPVVATDADGDAVHTWVDAFTTWASVQPVIGREALADQQLQTSADHEIAIRFRAAPIPPTWRIVWRDTALDIVGEPQDLDGRRTWLLLKGATRVRGAVDDLRPDAYLQDGYVLAGYVEPLPASPLYLEDGAVYSNYVSAIADHFFYLSPGYVPDGYVSGAPAGA